MTACAGTGPEYSGRHGSFRRWREGVDLTSECGYGLSDFFDGCSDVGEGGAVLAAGFGVGCECACCGVSEIAFDRSRVWCVGASEL